MSSLGHIHTSIQSRRVDSADGTSIAYYVAGRGPRVWIIPPGLGTPLVAWTRVFEHFADSLTMITWSQRGSYDSGVPARPGRLRVKDHVRDLEAVVAAEGVERFALGGWSLGVQTSLEYYHQHPENVSALLLLNGAYEHPLQTAFLPGLDRVLTPFVAGLARFGAPLTPLIRACLSVAPRVLPRLGLLANDSQLMRDVINAFGRHDWSVYFRAMLAVNKHSAASYLETVRVPTLITAGDADRMTPVATAREMQRRIPGSQLVIVPGGTHFSMIEFPERMNQVLSNFFSRHAVDEAQVG